MLQRSTQRWMRGCLAVPCLAAALCFGMVGCGGGGDDSGSTDSSTPTASDDAGTTTTTTDDTSGDTDAGSTTQ